MPYKIDIKMDCGAIMTNVAETKDHHDKVLESIFDNDIICTRFNHVGGKKQTIIMHDKIQYIEVEEL